MITKWDFWLTILLWYHNMLLRTRWNKRRGFRDKAAQEACVLLQLRHFGTRWAKLPGQLWRRSVCPRRLEWTACEADASPSILSLSSMECRVVSVFPAGSPNREGEDPLCTSGGKKVQPLPPANYQWGSHCSVHTPSTAHMHHDSTWSHYIIACYGYTYARYAKLSHLCALNFSLQTNGTLCQDIMTASLHQTF